MGRLLCSPPEYGPWAHSLRSRTSRSYTHDVWDVTGFQVLFCPTKQALLWCVEVVKSSDWEVFIVEIGHFYVKNRGSLSRVVKFLQVITFFHLTTFYFTLFYLPLYSVIS